MIITILLALLLWQVPASDFASIRSETDGQQRAARVEQLLKRFDRSMIPDVVKLSEQDPDAAVRMVIVRRLGRLPDPEIVAMLTRMATSDPDADVSLMALERLRQHQARQLGQVFDKRLELARTQGDQTTLTRLVAEHQRWMSFARGAILPAFLQVAPPVFEASPPAKSIRVIAFGDFGREGPNLQRVASAAAAYHREHPFNLGLTLGDNIYFDGATSPQDPRWKAIWEDSYGRLGIPFYASLGNHDWGFADSPAAEILYSDKSSTWHMPAIYYSFTAGPVQFFSLATDVPSQTQLRWLDEELRRSRARWKIVYGHAPIYSAGRSGGSPQLERLLLPVIKNRVDLYIAGHDHDMQHLKPEDGVQFVVAGGGGMSIRPIKPDSRTLFAGSFFGFAVLDASMESLRLTLIDFDGKIRYEARLK